MSSPYKQPYSRIRSRGALTKGISFTETASGLAANHSKELGWGAAGGKVESMTDVVTPAFNALQRRGQVLFRPMTRGEVTVENAASSNAVFTQTYPTYLAGQTYAYSGDWVSVLRNGYAPPTNAVPGGYSPKTLLSASQTDRAISEACTKAQRFPSDANLLVTFAELRRTMRLVPDLWTNWARFFQSFNGRVEYLYGKHLQANPARQAKQNLLALRKVTEETWLAMRFGVRPLIMDTLGVMKAIQADLPSEPVRITPRGSVQVVGSEVSSWNHDLGIFTGTIVSSYTHELSVRAMTLIEIELDSFERRIGLNIGSVPEAIVDLVSYSFVVNWMVTLNDFFSALGRMAQPGIKTLGGCYVVRDQKSGVYQLTNGWCNNTSFTMGSSPTGTASISVLNKYRVVGLRAPSITLRADPLKFLRDARLIDAIALVSTQMRRSRGL